MSMLAASQKKRWALRLQEEAESGCEIDYETFSRKGSDCARLDSFESFVRGLLGHSPMSSFAHLLYTLRKAELHEAQDAEGKYLLEMQSTGHRAALFCHSMVTSMLVQKGLCKRICKCAAPTSAKSCSLYS